ncbi:MAG TPA: glycerophosphodiester phosphodiesterase family protein [Nocardioidaceae bacterium]|nr:glycerophosphodiester phosphodiesterase family protein [Nocardioidaceae bacterium]
MPNTRWLGRAPAVVVLVVASALVALPAPATARTCALVAHRGEHATATENGMRALRAAVRRGADYLEVDVRATRDDRLVLMHDETLRRTTNGTGRVDARSARGIERLRLNDGGRVPSLRQALRLGRDAGVRVLVDIKDMGRAVSYRRLARAVRDLGGGRVVVVSRFRTFLDRFGREAPRVARGVVTKERLRPREFRRYGAAVVHHRAITAGWLAAMRDAGLPVFAWTVNTTDEWDRLSGRVRGVITDATADYADYRRRSSTCRR